MKYAIILFSGLFLAGCASVINVDDDKNAAIPAVAVAKPFEANPRALALATQLQGDYDKTPVQVLRVGNEVKVTYSSDALFGVGGEVLLSGAEGYLNALVTAVRVYPDVLWRVDSFTDKSGMAEKNLQCSQARAHAVASYFIEKGVASENITYKGYGADFPVATNVTAEGRVVNRRIVVTIKPPVPQSVT